MRFVAIKTVEQQDIQAAHRIRAELIGHRMAKANQIRGLVAEYGLVALRQMAASLGLSPKQHSSGGKDRLLGISKRGKVVPEHSLAYSEYLPLASSRISASPDQDQFR